MEKKMENEMETCVVGAKELGVSQKKGYHFSVPRTRIIVFWGLYRSPLFWETTNSSDVGMFQL